MAKRKPQTRSSRRTTRRPRGSGGVGTEDIDGQRPFSLSGSGAGSFPAQEALAAIYRAPLSRFEGDGGFPAALRAFGCSLGFCKTGSGRTLALGLASLAAF